MTRPFSRHGEGIRWRLQTWEVDLLRSLRDDLRALLVGGDPDDPVIQRLFPPASRQDREIDRELRGLMRDELLASRLSGLESLLDVLDRAEEHRGGCRVDLVDDEPMLVLGVLNDVRLALGIRVGTERLERGEIAEDDPVLPTLALMDHLALLQESLLGILDPPSLHHYEDHRHDE